MNTACDLTSSRPEWVPASAGAEFATRVVVGAPVAAPAARTGRVRRTETAEELAGAIRRGERPALARGITAVESRAPAHRALAAKLLLSLAPAAGTAVRVGISGAPGVGKSSFIDALGTQLCAAGRQVAVLSVDPSSPVSHGSILGDKTRMETLARQPRAFIRPSPSGGDLGGVTRRTRETITLCEAAGFDVVLVETVGVGQSEVVVRDMVDCFLVLLLAGAGDELQGMKKGLVELADVLAVNKADGDNRARAEAARAECARALHYLAGAAGESAWTPPVLTCSAANAEGVREVWQEVERFIAQARRSGAFDARRRAQAQAWLHALVDEGLREAYARRAGIAVLQRELEEKVGAGLLPAPLAAERLLAAAGFGA